MLAGAETLIARVWARLLFIVPFLVVGFVLELALNDRLAVSWRTRSLNLSLTVLYWAFDVIGSATLSLTLFWLLARTPGHGLLAGLTWQPTSPAGIFGMALVWVIVIDFFYYWMHRAQHRFAWLWAEHAVHHSDAYMNVTTTYRHHWLEKPFEAVAIVGPLAYLFTPPDHVVVTAIVLQTVMGSFIHMRARISFGWWNRLMATPQHHRIHHSIDVRHRDVNFAAVCPVWDVLFGTYYQPTRDEYPETGVADYPVLRTPWEASVAPFRIWMRALRSGR
jgi:sterol desaturase/sphingolipid hydroxylase (fatty acid hydroxylase superfamily)